MITWVRRGRAVGQIRNTSTDAVWVTSQFLVWEEKSWVFIMFYVFTLYCATYSFVVPHMLLSTFFGFIEVYHIQ